MEQLKLQSLSVILSCGCNLNCNYCEIAKSKQSLEYAANLQTATRKALKNGEFLNNIKRVYTLFNADLKKIENISFWGQEPTLNLDLLTENLQDWFKVFPAWNNSFFSTNGGTDPKIIINYIKEIDRLTPNPFEIHIQLSYDGELSCKNQRNINPELIKQNYKTIIDELNKTVLRKVKVFFNYHGVLNFNTMYDLKTQEDIKNYWQELDDFIYWAKTISYNPSCITAECLDLKLEQPYSGSVDDGLFLTNFLKKSYQLKNKLNLKNPYPLYGLLHSFVKNNNPLYQDMFNSDKWLHMIDNTLSKHEPLNNINTFLDSQLCGSYSSELKIMYDGTVIGCQNSIYSTNKDFLKENDPVLRSIKLNMINHKEFFNPLEENTDIKDIEKILDIFINGKNSFAAVYQSTLNTMLFLGEAGQIDQSYLRNKEKLLKHALMISLYNSCFYNNLITTGSHYLNGDGLCRLMCNGVLDFAEQVLNEISIKEKNYDRKSV